MRLTRNHDQLGASVVVDCKKQTSTRLKGKGRDSGTGLCSWSRCGQPVARSRHLSLRHSQEPRDSNYSVHVMSTAETADLVGTCHPRLVVGASLVTASQPASQRGGWGVGGARALAGRRRQRRKDPWHKTGFVLVGDALAVLDWRVQSQTARPLLSATSTMQGGKGFPRVLRPSTTYHSQSAEDQITRHGHSAAAADPERPLHCSFAAHVCEWMDRVFSADPNSESAARKVLSRTLAVEPNVHLYMTAADASLGRHLACITTNRRAAEPNQNRTWVSAAHWSRHPQP